MTKKSSKEIPFEQVEGGFTGSELHISDLAKSFESYGADVEPVERPADIKPALERALTPGNLTILDVIIDASRGHLEPPGKLWVKDRH